VEVFEEENMLAYFLQQMAPHNVLNDFRAFAYPADPVNPV